MLKKILFALLLFFSPQILYSQSLGKERVKNLKSAVVKVVANNGTSTGTGFFIHEDGWIVTCMHVVLPYELYTGKEIDLNSISDNMYVETAFGEKIEVEEIYKPIVKSNLDFALALSYDYCILKLKKMPRNGVYIYKLGGLSNIDEGDEIYSCGYPYGIKQQFISKGILSTKWVETLKLHIEGLPDKRNVAWLDITLNIGNSGGPIIKLGSSPNEDIIVGYVDFGIPPSGEYINNLKSYSQKLKENNPGMAFLNINFTDMVYSFSSTFTHISQGVNACIDFQHVKDNIR